jgi:hypothetical protein
MPTIHPTGMTLIVYADLFDDDLDALAERLDAATPGRDVPAVCLRQIVKPISQRRRGSDLRCRQRARQDSNLRPAD